LTLLLSSVIIAFSIITDMLPIEYRVTAMFTMVALVGIGFSLMYFSRGFLKYDFLVCTATWVILMSLCFIGGCNHVNARTTSTTQYTPVTYYEIPVCFFRSIGSTMIVYPENLDYEIVGASLEVRAPEGTVVYVTYEYFDCNPKECVPIQCDGNYFETTKYTVKW